MPEPRPSKSGWRFKKGGYHMYRGPKSGAFADATPSIDLAAGVRAALRRESLCEPPIYE